jgi:hypothetical protein
MPEIRRIIRFVAHYVFHLMSNGGSFYPWAHYMSHVSCFHFLHQTSTSSQAVAQV